MVYASKFITFKATIKQCRSFVKPFFTLGFYAILTSAYTTFNVTFLGIVAGDVEVGYYTTATKLYSIILSLFTAFTGVMLPRMSSLITEGKIDEFKKYTNNSIDLLFSFSIPLVILSSIAAPQIVMAISGPGYEGAILPMRIVMPLMLIIGYEQILVIQMLMPLKEDRAILRNSAIVAVISICLNLLLVQHFKSIGSAMIWVVSELVILVLSQIKIAKLIGLEFPYKRLIKALSLNIPLFILVLIVSITVSNTYKSLAISCVITLIYSMFITLKFYPTGIIANTSKQLISRIKK
jgi:O-antigen/teichoic acid export membrane protein